MTMDETTIVTQEQASGAKDQQAPWYSLNPKHLRFSKFTWLFIAVAGVIGLFFAVTIKPLWTWGWRTHIECATQMWPVTSAKGKKFKAGAWARSKRIIVYGSPGVDIGKVQQATEGMQSLVKELGLDFTVEMVDAPADAIHTLNATLKANSDDPRDIVFDFDRYVRLRLDDRGNHYGEIVVVKAEGGFADPNWAFGLTAFPEGVAALREDMTNYDLGRHEGAHLIGYDKHDDIPFYILGYHENIVPANRNTLMMLLPKPSSALSARARDALHNFWLGMERMSGEKYFK